jgi:hypothetical protein
VLSPVICPVFQSLVRKALHCLLTCFLLGHSATLQNPVTLSCLFYTRSFSILWKPFTLSVTCFLLGHSAILQNPVTLSVACFLLCYSVFYGNQSHCLLRVFYSVIQQFYRTQSHCCLFSALLFSILWKPVTLAVTILYLAIKSLTLKSVRFSALCVIFCRLHIQVVRNLLCRFTWSVSQERIIHRAQRAMLIN